MQVHQKFIMTKLTINNNIAFGIAGTNNSFYIQGSNNSQCKADTVK